MARDNEIIRGDYVRFVIPTNVESDEPQGFAGRGYVRKELGSLAEIQVVAGEVELTETYGTTFLKVGHGQYFIADKHWLEVLVGKEYDVPRLEHTKQLMGLG
jgi:hypothetical protein